jgi:autotransporter adhesin
MKFFLALLLFLPTLGLAQTASPSQIDSNSNLTNQNAGNSVAGSTNVVYGESNSTSSTSNDNMMFGYGNGIDGSVNYVYGYFNTVAGTDNLSMGEYQTVEGSSIICLGVSDVCGSDPTASQFDANVGIGSFVTATGSSSIAIGSSAQATGDGSVALGAQAFATSKHSIAIGTASTAGFDNCLALGFGSACTSTYQVAVGSPYLLRTLSFVAPGIAPTDAVNVGQLTSTLAMLGGGAGLDANGNPVAPMYVLTNPYTPGSYSTVGDALTALDTAIGDVNKQPGPVGPQGPQGNTGPEGPAGKDGTDVTGSGTDPLAVHYDSASESEVTLQGANGTTIHNLAAGVAPTDAADVAQIQEALQSARNYTDLKAVATLSQANAYTDLAVGGLNDKINAARASASAEANLAGTYAGADPRSPNRMATAIGNFGNRNAMALGYQHVSVQSRNRWTWNASATLDSAGRSSVGAGFGFSW